MLVETRYSTSSGSGEAGAVPSCRLANSWSHAAGIFLVGFRPCLAYAFNMAAVPFRLKLGLGTASTLKVEPATLIAGAAWAARARARTVMVEIMLEAADEVMNERL